MMMISQVKSLSRKLISSGLLPLRIHAKLISLERMDQMVRFKLSIRLSKFREKVWPLLVKTTYLRRALFCSDMEKQLRLSILQLFKSQVKREMKLLRSSSLTFSQRVQNLVRKISIW